MKKKSIYTKNKKGIEMGLNKVGDHVRTSGEKFKFAWKQFFSYFTSCTADTFFVNHEALFGLPHSYSPTFGLSWSSD